jgi:broad specificity phosphatase PhoE
MTRHGESLNNTHNIIGGNPSLTQTGEQYAKKLAEYMKKYKNLTVWTSNLLRTQETARHFDSIISFSELNEISSGDFENFNLDIIKSEYPDIYEHRNNDKMNNSYPNGENYLDLKKRVYKLLNTIDTKKDCTLLIICHQAICRVIYSYFSETSIDKCIDIDIDLHTIYKFSNKKLITKKLITKKLINYTY